MYNKERKRNTASHAIAAKAAEMVKNMLNFKINRSLRLVCAFLCIALSLNGCRSAAPNEQSLENGKAQQPVEERSAGSLSAALAKQGIELPQSRAHIYVNQAGYSSERGKKAIFVLEDGVSGFRVVRASDKEVVYTGEIVPFQQPDGNASTLGTGDFSQLTQAGTYYIECDTIGRSYPFTIAQDAYENLFLGLLRNMSDANPEESVQGVCDISFGMDILMYSLQCNGALYEEAYTHLSDGGYEGDMVTQLLQMAQWLLSRQEADGSLYGDYEATAAFCGAITMSLDTFGVYQSSVAQEYADSAQKAWEWLERQNCDTDVRKAARFYAAAQLFKSEGKEQYRNIVLEFLKGEIDSYSDNRFVFYGAIAYMNSQRADRDLCTQIMIGLVDDTEQLGNEAKNDALFGIGGRSVRECLENILLIGFTNYITPNKEYTAIIENTIQYMGGLNEKGECYISGEGVWQSAEETADRGFEWNAILLFGYSDMLKNLNDMKSSA